MKKLVPFDRERIALNQALPFGLYGPEGRLMLSAGQAITSPERLQEVLAGEVFADSQEVSDWERRMGAAVDEALRRNGTLGAVANAQPKQLAQGAQERSSATLPTPCDRAACGLHRDSGRPSIVTSPCSAGCRPVSASASRF